ncbi:MULTISPECIES: AAA family ATPase [unclassified Bradyrhizobium]|uniref:AAA family ATPase n=1 Tax=unclassified Bradyrhizobium TaxID=2631580 RepID=UPI0004651064|nr:hypothetical protein QU42_02620 [Bradyrhizobium sp. UASWS1016]
MQFVTLPEWPAEQPPPVDWFAHGKTPRADVTILSGDGGTGKTMTMPLASCASARGAQDWLGIVIELRPAVFLLVEERARDTAQDASHRSRTGV